MWYNLCCNYSDYWRIWEALQGCKCCWLSERREMAGPEKGFVRFRRIDYLPPCKPGNAISEVQWQLSSCVQRWVADNHKQLMIWTGKMARHYLLLLMSVFFLIGMGRTSFGHTAAWQTGTKYCGGFSSGTSDAAPDRIVGPAWRSSIVVHADDIRDYPNQVLADAGGVENQPFYAMEWLDGARLINGDGRFDHWKYDINTYPGGPNDFYSMNFTCNETIINDNSTYLSSFNFSSFDISDTTFGSINSSANSAISAATSGTAVFIGFFLVGLGSLGRKRLVKKNG